MQIDFFKDKFEFYREFSKRDRIIFIICLLLGTFSSALLTPYFDDLLEMRSLSQSNQPIIGKITYKSNDVQIKSQEELIWFKAKTDQDVRTGDSVFSGEKSYSQIEINKTNKIVLGENSLILFQEILDEKLANLKDGNFRLKVDGNIKVAIGGKLAEIKGDKSEIQVFLSKNQPAQVKLLSGQATLSESGKDEQVLSEGTIAKIDVATEEPLVKSAPILSAVAKSQSYIWKLNDFYELQDSKLVSRPVPESISMQKELSWFVDKPGNETIIEIAGKMDFSNKKTYTTSGNNIGLSEIFAGKNYWRVKEKDGEWSTISEFDQNTEFKKSPSIYREVSYDKNLPLVKDQVDTKIKFRKSSDVSAYILESSTDENFKSENHLNYVSDSEVNQVYEKTGNYYYRFRSVNNAQEISNWSDTFMVSVFNPKTPDSPKLGLAKTKIFLSEELALNWTAASNEKILTEVRDSKNRLVKQYEGHSINDKFEKPGSYTAMSWSVDKYGQRSSPSSTVQIEVFPDPMVLLNKDRNVASAESAATDIFSVGEKFSNDGYKLPKFSMNAFVWNLISSQQIANAVSAPSVTGVGVKIMHWMKNHGFSGSIKSGLSSNVGSQSQLKSLEGLYHYRFVMASNRYFRELQVSLMAGFETYRNVNDLVFSSKYDLVKTGVDARFPWAEKWVGHGSFIFGYGLDGSTKYEFSAGADYYLNTVWSLGLGYRIHLFQAGSASSSGSGLLPYREGYTEGYTLLNYDY